MTMCLKNACKIQNIYTKQNHNVQPYFNEKESIYSQRTNINGFIGFGEIERIVKKTGTRALLGKREMEARK